MSELDLSAPDTQSTPATSTDLVLAPPAPVQIVEPAQAAGAFPVEDAKKAELTAKANAYAAELVSLDTKSPAFTQKINSITSMGAQ
jgi:hypothetical protein